MKTTVLFVLLLSLFTLTTSAGRTHRRPALAPSPVATFMLPVPARQLHQVRAPQAGRLWEVYVQPGDMVRRGQLLAKVAIPLHSLEKQAREAQLQRSQHHYSSLVQANASAADLSQARRELVEAEHQVATAPKVYSFEFITATASGTVQGRLVQPGQYLTESSTVALLATPLSGKMPPSVALK